MWRGHGLVHYPFPVNRLLDSNGRGQLDIIILLSSSSSSVSSWILIFWWISFVSTLCNVSGSAYKFDRQIHLWSFGLFCGLTDLEQTDRDPVIEKLGALSVVLDRGYWERSGVLFFQSLSILTFSFLPDLLLSLPIFFKLKFDIYLFSSFILASTLWRYCYLTTGR